MAEADPHTTRAATRRKTTAPGKRPKPARGEAATAAERLLARADTAARYAGLQRLMFDAVTRPLVGDDASDPVWRDGRDANALLGAFVKGDAFRDPLRRVQTYNRMYWYRTLDSLAEDFPGVRAVTGKRFIALAEAYLQKHPSTSFTLRHLGRAFPAWLKRNSQKLPSGVARAAAECAAVEWALCQAFELETGEPPDPATFARPEKLKLSLQPHLSLHALTHDVPDFLDRLRLADNEHAEAGNAATVSGPSDAPKAKAAFRIRKKKTYVVVFRTHDNGLATVKISAAEHALLADIDRGLTLARALDRAASRRGAPDVTTVGRWFSSWSARGWLVARR